MVKRRKRMGEKGLGGGGGGGGEGMIGAKTLKGGDPLLSIRYDIAANFTSRLKI